jgi:hypothetical protein
MNQNMHSGELPNFIRDADFPISKVELLNYIRENGASEEIITAIEEAPTDGFDSPSEIRDALEQSREELTAADKGERRQGYG